MEIDLTKIIALREHLKKTQEEAGKAIGLGRTTYIAREKTGNFSKEEIDRLAVFFGVKSEELYKQNGTPIHIEDSINRLTEIAIRTESLQRAIVVGLAKLIALQTGMDAAKILEDLTAVANQESSSFQAELKRMADL